MDRRRMRMHADAEAAGGRVVDRRRRVEKLAVVVVVQNVLVVACLLVTFYVYHSSGPEKDVHIVFEVTPVLAKKPETTLQSLENVTSHRMDLADGSNITTNCKGPYVFYMEVCFQSLDNEETSATLKLQLEGRETLISFDLKGSILVCRELNGMVHLKVKKKAILRVYPKDSRFKIKSAIVGLNYMLGSRCDF